MKKYILVGSFASIKMNHEKITNLITAKGGQVLNISSIPEGLPVEVIVVSTQKECDKGSASLGITTAFQRNWKIVSPQYVLTVQEQTLDIDNYLLPWTKCMQHLGPQPCTPRLQLWQTLHLNDVAPLGTLSRLCIVDWMVPKGYQILRARQQRGPIIRRG